MFPGIPALGSPGIGGDGGAGIVVTMFKGWMKFMEFLGEVIKGVIFTT
jgi:cystathionine beta-lyase family protein involved in aluminum resistance